MPQPRRLGLLTVATIVAAMACSPAAGPSISPGGGSPDASASPSGQATGGIDHPTGSTDVVLRYEEGGGLMVIDWAVADAPIFTLYGDGTVVFRDPADQPPPDQNGLLASLPLRTARLSAEQMDALLSFAVAEGGLGAARERYDDPAVADGGTTTFTINAGGRSKVVSIYSLGLRDDAPDPVSRRQFQALADRLRAFDQDGSLPTAEYEPHGWRAVLIESPGIPTNLHDWPWPDIEPADFVPTGNDPAAPGFKAHVLSADDIAAMGLGDLKGGLLGYYAKGPDGKTYSIPIRPLFPDEER